MAAVTGVTIAALLARLDSVRKTAKGWAARCPAHSPDRHPSLSIREGERGHLVYCFSGCTLDEICAALGIEPRDLFFDRAQRAIPNRNPSRPEPRRMTPREGLKAAEFELWRGAVARDLRGLRTPDLARGLDCSTWNSDDFDRAMAAACRGYADLRVADRLHVLAFGLREHIQKGDVDATEAIPGCRPTADGVTRTAPDSSGARGQHRAT